MREVILRLEDNLLTNQEDLERLGLFSSNYRLCKIVFDFTHATIHDYAMVALLALLMKLKANGFKFGYIFDESEAKDKNLLTTLRVVGFLELLLDEVSEPKRNWNSFIPINKFTHETIRSFLEFTARKWMKTHLKSKKADIEPLLTAILEVCNNIKDHANAEYGLFFASITSAGKVFNFYIADSGGGIPHKIQSSPQYSHLSDEEALIKSLEYGVSTANAHGRGAGLPHLLNAITDYYKGSIYITSNSISLAFKHNENVFKFVKPRSLDGTLIAISINIDYIPEIDTREFIYEPSGDVWNV